MELLENTIDNFKYLNNDFVGIIFDVSGLISFSIHIIIASIIFLFCYLLGKKINYLLFKETNQYVTFINIALGYALIGTGIGILGFFSLLKSPIIWSYLFIIVLISLSPFNFDFKKCINFLKNNINLKIFFKRSFIIWSVVLFVSISFFRLITPEITEDAYHTDLPRVYLSSTTTMHESRDPLHVIPYPQLAEMIYIIPIFLGDKEATRFIHFGFYLLIIYLLFAIANKEKIFFIKFAPLLFVTAPIMIRYSPSQYVDFSMVFFFILSILLIKKNISYKKIVLSGLIFGSVLSIKLWTLIYMPAVVLFLIILNKKSKIIDLFKKSLLFISSALLIPLLWYIRAFVITGNPIYPLFSKVQFLEVNHEQTASSYFGFNSNMFALSNMIVFSPIFFAGAILFILYFRKSFKLLQKFNIAIFFLIIMCEQLIVKVDLGRYLIAWYVFAVMVISAGISVGYKNIFVRNGLIMLYLGIFAYYFINTLLILPYGLGWADKNAYLSRVLGRDNASYYNFDNLFDKWINKNDFVATYGIYGYYYANFNYIDVNYIFRKDSRSIDLLKKRQVTKILIKGGDFEWFCKELGLIGCNNQKVKLLATYPADIKKYNLYLIQY